MHWTMVGYVRVQDYLLLEQGYYYSTKTMVPSSDAVQHGVGGRGGRGEDILDLFFSRCAASASMDTPQQQVL